MKAAETRSRANAQSVSVAYKMLLLGLVLLLSVLALEVGVRMFARLTLRGWVVTADPILGWRLAPNARKNADGEEGSYRIVINSKGLRDREYEYARASSVFRIIVLGDSFVFGLGGVEQPEVFTEILRASAPNLDVINMGVPAFSLDQECLYLEMEGLKYQPNLVILGLFENDFEESFLPFNESINRPKGYVSSEAGELRFHPPVMSWFYQLGGYSHLVGLLHRTLLPPRWGTPTPPTLTPELKRKMFAEMLLRARALTKRRDAEFVVIRFPALHAMQPDPVQEVLRTLERTEDLYVLDFADDFRRAGPAGAYHFARDGHLNRRGHERVATALYAYLAERTSFGKHVQQQVRPTTTTDTKS